MQANIEILRDLDVMEQIHVHEISGSASEIIEFLHSRLSAGSQASLERSGDIDAMCVGEMFADHNEGRELAMLSLEQAVAWSQRAGTYETVTTALAVGLAFAAWASLMERTSRTHWMFAIIAALVLLASLGFLGVQLATSEPFGAYASFHPMGRVSTAG